MSTTFNAQESAAATCQELEFDKSWGRVQYDLAQEKGGDFKVVDCELTADTTTQFSGLANDIQIDLSLRVRFFAVDDGAKECRAALIRGLRDYLDRVERR